MLGGTCFDPLHDENVAAVQISHGITEFQKAFGTWREAYGKRIDI